MRRVRRFLAIVTISSSVIVPLACGSDSAVGPNGSDNSPLGGYSLTSISGKATPITMFSDTNYLVVISSGSLAVNSDGTYLSVTTTNETVLNHLSTYVDTARGTWITGTGSGSLVFTNSDDLSKSNASWGSGKLTLVQGTGTDTMTIVYTRK